MKTLVAFQCDEELLDYAKKVAEKEEMSLSALMRYHLKRGLIDGKQKTTG